MWRNTLIEFNISLIFYIISILPTILGVHIMKQHKCKGWDYNLSFALIMFIITVVCMLVGLGYDGVIGLK